MKMFGVKRSEKLLIEELGLLVSVSTSHMVRTEAVHASEEGFNLMKLWWGCLEKGPPPEAWAQL